MSFAAPTRKAHLEFCQREGWTEVRNATNKRGHHLTFELALPDGRILRTRVSRPPDKSTYGPDMWSHILRHQLAVTEAEFWAFLEHGTPPEGRGISLPADVEALPAGLIYQLAKLGVPETELAHLTKQTALELLHRLRGEPPVEPSRNR